MWKSDGLTRPGWKSCKHPSGASPRCPDCGVMEFRNATARGRTRVNGWLALDGTGGVQVVAVSDHAPDEKRSHKKITDRPLRPHTGRARKDRCKYGHLMTEENVYTTPLGKRSCITCKRKYSKEWQRAKRAVE